MSSLLIARIPMVDDRLTTYPIGRPDVWKYYEAARDSYWTPAEIKFTDDRQHYIYKLDDPQRHFVKFILAFFASSDKIVNINIAKRFKEDISIPEVDYFYDAQTAIENIHAETYSLQLMTIIPDPKERDFLFDSIRTLPIITKMTKYMFDTINSKEPFATRLLRMACVEGIMFQSAFCAIYWLQSRSLMPGLAHANELIARDESLHTQFALHLYSILLPEHKITTDAIYSVFREAVGIAKEFASAALPIGLPEMNYTLLSQYIECTADNILVLLDVKPLFGNKNPFRFMDQINYTNRTNFFERRVSEYSKPHHADDDDWNSTTTY